MPRLRTLAPLLVAAPIASSVGCAKKAPQPPSVGLSTPKATHSGPAPAAKAPYPLLPAAQISRLPEGSTGPYLAAHPDHALLVLGTPASQSAQPAWLSLATAADGTPRGPAKAVGPAPQNLTSIALRPSGNDGFVLIWARRGESGHLVEALSLDESGAARGGPQLLYQGAEPLVWVDAAAAGAGAHGYFAVSSGNRTRLFVASIGPSGEAKGSAQLASDGASAWQIAPSPQGSMLLTVRAAEGKTTGQLLATPVDAQGRPGPAELIEPREAAELDLDAVRFGERIAVGWTDRSGVEGAVKIALLEPSGKPVGPATSPLRSAGDQALVGLAASTGPVPRLLVAWDDLALRASVGRKVRLTSLGPDARGQGESATLSVGLREEASPLLGGTTEGFSLLTLAQACRSEAPSCKDAPVWPTTVKLSPELEVQGSSPLVIEPLGGEPPELAWGMACTGKACLALTADAGQPPQPPSAYLARLEPQGEAFRPVVERDASREPPTASKIESLWKGPRLADLAAAPLAESTLVASVTLHAEGSPPPPLPRDVDARAEADKDRARAKSPKSVPPRGALVSVHTLDAKGALTSTRTLSVRALSSPGVAIAPDAERKGACVAWVARDGSDPEVFLTLVDAEGKRKAQQMLTHAKGDVSDVAIVPAEDGFLVAWIDGRHGNGEVYAARVDKTLRRKGPEVRVTNAPGDASELDLMVGPSGEALVAFSDARSSPKDGVGDVYLARLRLSDAAKLGDEVRVAATPEHARAVRLARLGDEALLTWVEQPPPSSQLGDRKAALQLVMLDPKGTPRSLPESLSLPGQGPVTSLNLSCDKAGCRFVVGKPDGEGLGLFGFGWQKGQRDLSPHRLASLFASASADVVPTFAAGSLLVADEGSSGEGRLRRVDVRW